MVSELFPHTYLKAPCLQVFLYTDVDKLITEAATLLLCSTHTQPVYGIVPSSQLKKALFEKMQVLQGFCSFVKIGTLPQMLSDFLKSTSFKLHDERSVSFVIYELLLAQDERLAFLKLGGLKPKDLLVQAKVLAKELNALLAEEYLEKEHLLRVIEAIKEKAPAHLFIHEALVFIKEKLSQMVFIGFDTLEPQLIKFLQTIESKAFCLVPTGAYLGDLLSAKNRLKLLRQYALDQEHPLLESFTQDYRSFYNQDLSIELQETELKNEPLSLLQNLQVSLQEGIAPSRLMPDETLCIASACSPYQEALKLLAYLQNRAQQHSDLVQQNIILLTSNKEQYVPLLNALGSSFEPKIAFQEAKCPDMLWKLIAQLLSTPEEEKGINFFISIGIKLAFIYKDDARAVCFKDLETLFLNAHKILYFEPQEALTGLTLLKALQKSCLKASVFEEEDRPYELVFCDLGNYEELEPMLSCLQQLIDVLAVMAKVQTATMQGWIKHLLELFELPLWQALSPFEWRKTALDLYLFFKDLKATFEAASLCEFIGASFATSAEEPAYGIQVLDLHEMPHRSFDLVLYLGLNPEKKPFSLPLLGNAPLRYNTHHYPLWFNQAKKGIYYSYLEGYPDASVMEAHPWIEALRQLCPYIKAPPLSMALVEPQLKKEFWPENLSFPLLEQARYLLEASHVAKYIKDPQEYARRVLLLIKEQSPLLDKDIAERHLLLWKVQQLLNLSKMPLGVDQDPFKEFSVEPLESSSLRNRLAPAEDQLLHIQVLPTLEVCAEESTFILQGVLDPELEAKVLKHPQKLLALQALKEFLCD